jgi:hypothetical protein
MNNNNAKINTDAKPTNGDAVACGEVVFKFSKYGLNKQSWWSFIISIIAVISTVASWVVLAAGWDIIFNNIHMYTYEQMNPVQKKYLIFLLILNGSALLAAFVALTFGIIGLIKPNPGFGRALLVILFALLSTAGVLNLLLLFFMTILLRRPTKNERQTAQGLGIPIPKRWPEGYMFGLRREGRIALVIHGVVALVSLLIPIFYNIFHKPLRHSFGQKLQWFDDIALMIAICLIIASFLWSRLSLRKPCPSKARAGWVIVASFWMWVPGLGLIAFLILLLIVDMRLEQSIGQEIALQNPCSQ